MTNSSVALHLLAVGINLAGLVLFAWAYSATGSGVFAALCGYYIFQGACSTHAVLMARRRRGIQA